MRALLLKAGDWVRQRGYHPGVSLACACVVALFVWTLSQFYIPGKGFSYLIAFGSSLEDSRISKVRKLGKHVQQASDGYDAQFYVQIAMDPSLQNRELRKAMDSLAYRGRRILFSATAYAFGLGKPARILQAFALQNALVWVLLAALLLHWFPPRTWDNFFRWCGVMFSYGLCVSVRNSLFDGPSLLLVAFGVFLLEKGRPWWSTAVLAISGLGKETNLLAASALAPGFNAGPREWGKAVLRGILVALPLALWLVYINMTVGPALDAGMRNFDLPLAAYFQKWRDIISGLGELSLIQPGPLWSLLMLVALTVQFLFIVCRPRWQEAWWRVGFSFALLMVFLGSAVWEGYPSAASRVLLPMQLAFNVLVPVGRGWRVLLLLGNLTMLAAPEALETPPGKGRELRGSLDLLFNAEGEGVTVELQHGWYDVERGGENRWVWSSGTGEIEMFNPHPGPLEIKLRFGLSATRMRTVRVRLNGQEVWSTRVSDINTMSVSLSQLPLAPGNNLIEFVTDEEAARAGHDPRPLSFCVRNLRVDLRRKLPPAQPAR